MAMPAGTIVSEVVRRKTRRRSMRPIKKIKRPKKPKKINHNLIGWTCFGAGLVYLFWSSHPEPFLLAVIERVLSFISGQFD